MEIIEIIGLLLIGVAAFTLQIKKNFRFVGFLNLLIALSVVLFFKQFAEEESQPQLYGILALLGANFVFAQIKALQKPVIRVIVPLLSFGMYFYYFNESSIIILSEEYMTINKFIVSGVLLSLLAFELGTLKELAIKKIVKGLDLADIVKSVTILFMAFAIFLGGFASASFGLLLIASAFVIASFYRDDESKGYGVSFLTLSVLGGVLSLTGDTEVNLIAGDVLEGLFIGVFGAYFINQLWQTTSKFILFIGYLLLFGFSAGLLFLQTIYGQMGGMDAFVGVIIGTAIVNIIKGKEYVGQTIFVLLLLVGSTFPSLLNIQAEIVETEIIENVNSKEEIIEEVIPLKTIDLSQLKGMHELNPTSSNVLFTLGKKGETKGKFTNVSGEFIFGEEITSTSFSIELKMENFTTFNSFRDQSLMGDEYFKTDKFPIMTYKGNKLEVIGENQYEITGKFMMLGVAKELKVTLTGAEKDGKNILLGKGKIDRRDFGMSPSATEGNIVSFEYEVQLRMEN